MDNLARRAVGAALTGNWKEAVKLNLSLLKNNPKDIEALNRLAKAYAELGKISLAKRTSAKALKIDPFNKIAIKCAAKWKELRPSTINLMPPSTPDTFLEEPGKTKLVTLLHAGGEKALAMIDTGDELQFSPHAHRVNVITAQGEYVGRLSDDLASRIRKLLQKGYNYKVIVKSADEKDVKVFIREVSRNKNTPGSPSFPAERLDYTPYTSPELIHTEI